LSLVSPLSCLTPSPTTQGTLGATGIDIPAAIRRMGKRIKFVHFRDVVGVVPK
jgi:D-mannonate dehydratase